MRFKIDFSYDGSSFHGYQKQPGKRTVQSEIESLLSSIDESNVKLVAAGRTDKGVNALHQIAHFDFHKEITAYKLKGALNGRLKGDIYINDVELVEDSFHARFSAIGKEYIYKLNMGEYNPLERNLVYQHNEKLDVVEMQRAMKYLEGTNNFKAFTKSDEEREDYVRTLSQTNLIRDMKDVNKITLVFVGTGFMRYMVRNMVGTLIEIGEGKRRSEEIIDIIKSEDRTNAGKTANPEGLYLKNVFY